jgi:carboxypeptidase PM20D1
MSLAAALGLSLASLLALAIAVVLIRTLAAASARPIAPPLREEALEEATGVELALSALVRRATVSRYRRGEEDEEAFSGFKRDLAALFPLSRASMRFEEIGDRGLLYEWEGSDPSLAPAIICAHFDVVPAEDAARWRRGPFSGEIAEACVWGRGAQDVKVTLACALHAAERLLGAGFRPRRSLYFAFGGDVEVGGSRGARLLGRALAARGVRASFLLDEGGPIADGLFSFAKRPLALIGVAEKGYLDVTLEAAGAGGHASMPPRRTAVGDLARAVAAIEGSASPARLGYTLRSFLGAIAPYASFPTRALFRNLWLFAPLVKVILGSSPGTNALMRSTCAPTMLEGSAKENVLADSAKANINARIVPGESSAEVLARLGALASSHGATVRPAHLEDVKEPLPESPVDHEGYRAISAALAASFPEAVAVPFLFAASTDTKHYLGVAEAMYRLTPILQSPSDLEGVHGRDERVEIANLRRCEIFYKKLLESL